MLFDLPDHPTLYQALLDRNSSYEGRAWVCVATTGIFCRFVCPARKPKSENCTFRDTIAECIEAGFRPCKRCKPLDAAAGRDPIVSDLLGALDADPGHRWSEGDVSARGYESSTVRRAFKRQFGMTFLEMARQRRLREGFEVLAGGGRVIDAQIEASFESPAAFRAAVARLLGVTPAALRGGGMLQATWIPTPLGDMIAVACPTHLHLLEFTGRKALAAELKELQASVSGGIGIGETEPAAQARAELDAFFAGRQAQFATPLAYHGSAFSREVWEALRTIPAGETRSYSQIAREIGRPDAVRAVARANGANRIALMVPCHRVIGADGRLTGYGGGLWRKQRLIEIEAAYRSTAPA